MTSLHFHKMHGCGNDFLLLDGFDSELPSLDAQLVRAMCDRHFGAGADGLLALTPGRNGGEAAWQFYNCDGSTAEMCGNAARCATLYLIEKRFPGKPWVGIETAVGLLKGRKVDNGLAEVGLRLPSALGAEYEEKVIKRPDGGAARLYCVDTGVPHAVVEAENIEAAPIEALGKFLVRHPAFPRGTNVTFFQRRVGNEIASTTFERGVETETYACGTGVAAAAIVFSQLYAQPFPIRVVVPGGTLMVNAGDDERTVWLEGPAEYVFEGEWTGQLGAFRPRSRFSERCASKELT